MGMLSPTMTLFGERLALEFDVLAAEALRVGGVLYDE